MVKFLRTCRGSECSHGLMGRGHRWSLCKTRTSGQGREHSSSFSVRSKRYMTDTGGI